MASEAGRWWGRPVAEMRWQAELVRRAATRPSCAAASRAATAARSCSCRGSAAATGRSRTWRSGSAAPSGRGGAWPCSATRAAASSRAVGARMPDRVSHVVAMGAGLSRQFDVAAPRSGGRRRRARRAADEHLLARRRHGALGVVHGRLRRRRRGHRLARRPGMEPQVLARDRRGARAARETFEAAVAISSRASPSLNR